MRTGPWQIIFGPCPHPLKRSYKNPYWEQREKLAEHGAEGERKQADNQPSGPAQELSPGAEIKKLTHGQF